jgi:thioester reductase-like protein
VNFIYPYHDLKASNVSGTQEILKMACRSRLKPSITYQPSEFSPVPDIRRIEASPKAPRSFPIGPFERYSESKWVAEKVLEVARGRGIPVGIYRLGEVVGSEKTGR